MVTQIMNPPFHSVKQAQAGTDTSTRYAASSVARQRPRQAAKRGGSTDECLYAIGHVVPSVCYDTLAWAVHKSARLWLSEDRGRAPAS